MAVSVRIAGKRGKMVVQPKDGATVIDVVREAAAQLGLDQFDTVGVVYVVDGQETTGDQPVGDAQKVDAAPKARLG